MATLKCDKTVGLQTSKGEEVEQIFLPTGTEVDIIKEWDRFYLVKDRDGHFYNLPKEDIAP